jgi:hypothetical protein
MKKLIFMVLSIMFITQLANAEVTYKFNNTPSVKIEDSIKRTCEIVPKLLGMEKIEVTIKVYFVKDRIELRAKCPIRTGRTPEAYYIPALNTIFMYRYTRPVFAHELTHALLNAYFGKSLPHEIQEIIPQYVENAMRKIY